MGVVDPRKANSTNHRFVVQKRRSLDMRPLSNRNNGGEAMQNVAFTGCGAGGGSVQGVRTSTSTRAVKAAQSSNMIQAHSSKHLPRSQHTSSIVFEEEQKGGQQEVGEGVRMTKRKQAQQLATDLSTGKIDTTMFAVGLRALGVDNNQSSEAMRLANKNGPVQVGQLSRAITMQL